MLIYITERGKRTFTCVAVLLVVGVISGTIYWKVQQSKRRQREFWAAYKPPTQTPPTPVASPTDTAQPSSYVPVRESQLEKVSHTPPKTTPVPQVEKRPETVVLPQRRERQPAPAPTPLPRESPREKKPTIDLEAVLRVIPIPDLRREESKERDRDESRQPRGRSSRTEPGQTKPSKPSQSGETTPRRTRTGQTDPKRTDSAQTKPPVSKAPTESSRTPSRSEPAKSRGNAKVAPKPTEPAKKKGK